MIVIADVITCLDQDADKLLTLADLVTAFNVTMDSTDAADIGRTVSLADVNFDGGISEAELILSTRKLGPGVSFDDISNLIKRYLLEE